MSKELNEEVTPTEELDNQSSNEEALWNKSDEELEAEYKKIKHSSPSKDDEIDETIQEDVSAINSLVQSDEELEPVITEQPQDKEVDSADEENDKNNNASKNSSEEQPENNNESKGVNGITLKPLKAAGKEIPIDNIDELYQLASKGLDYTRKMQNIKPFRSAVELMQQQGLSVDDLNLLVDIKQGNKDALKAVIKDLNIDPYEDLTIDDEPVDYKPNNYAPDPKLIEVNEVIDSISSDPEFETTNKVISDILDDMSKSKLLENPNLINLLHNDVKQGLFFEVEPLVTKQKLINNDNRPFLEVYAEMYGNVVDKLKTTAKTTTQTKINNNTQQSVKRKSASVGVTKKSNPQRTFDDYHINYMDMSDDEFDELYNNIMNRI